MHKFTKVFVFPKKGCLKAQFAISGGGGGYVSLGLVHHPRKSLSEKHPKQGILGNFDTLYRETIGQLWFLDPLQGFFSCMLHVSYTLFKYCNPFAGHFDLKETKKRPIITSQIGDDYPQLPEHTPYPFCGHVWGSCEFDTLFLRFPRFRYPKRDTRVMRLVAKRIPFLRVFIYADDVQAPMRHTLPGPIFAESVISGFVNSTAL